MSKTDYLSMFKMMPESERKAMMDAYASFSKKGESADMEEAETASDEMSELEKMQMESDRELGLIKSEPSSDEPLAEQPAEEAAEEAADESVSEDETVDPPAEEEAAEDTDALLNKGMSVIEQAVSTEVDISDLSQYLVDDEDIQAATEVDASGFLKSLVEGNSASLDQISKSLNEFGQQQRATNLTVLALGRMVQGFQRQIDDLNKSLSAPVRAKGAFTAPQAEAMQKSFEGQQKQTLSKSEVLANLQDKLVKNLDNPNLSAQITDAIIRYESTGSISDEMMALASK